MLAAPEAARLLSLSGRTLEKDRTYGTGPAYRKDRRARRLRDRGSQSLGRPWHQDVDLGPRSGAVLPAKRHVAVSPAYTDRPRR